MNEALILEKLDKLSEEVRSIKSEVLQEIRQELEPVLNQTQPGITTLLDENGDESSNEKLVILTKNLLASLDEVNGVVSALRAGVELKDELGPIAKQVYPKSIEFFDDALHIVQ